MRVSSLMVNEKNKEKKPPKVIRMEKFSNDGPIAEETIKLMQMCIQMDTTNPPGNETVLAKKLKEYFDKENIPFLKTEIIEPLPNRGNLIVTVEGSDPNGKIYGFASHLDVVPAEPSLWKHHPFSGTITQETHDRFIWGRGAFDMKNVGVSFSIALLTLLREGFRPKNTIRFIFEADEEKGGHDGMKILVDQYWEKVKCDYLMTEGGGFEVPLKGLIAIQIGEKGVAQTYIRAKGVSGHGSAPDSYDKFAMYKIVEFLNELKKIKPKIDINQEFKWTVDALPLPGIAKFLLKRERLLIPLINLVEKITKIQLSKLIVPLASDTIAPTVFKAGQKENVISPTAELILDIRILNGHTQQMVWDYLKKKINKKVIQQVEFDNFDYRIPTTTPPGTDYYDLIYETLKEMKPNSKLLPMMSTGSTDMRYYRLKGVPCYGFHLLLKDEDISLNEMASLPHSENERISVSNLMIPTEYYYRFMSKL